MTDCVIVTVSYYSSPYIETMVRSLRPSRTSVEVIVANNATDDRTPATLWASDPSVTVLEMSHNLGYGGAVNEALRQIDADAPWILVVNPDIEFHDSALETLITAASHNESIGMVGPMILTPTNETYPSARRLPSLRTGIGHAIFGRIWPRNPWTLHYVSDLSVSARQADWISGSCMLIRRSAFERVGGFDQKYFMYFEDVDLGARMAEAGYTVRYEPSAVVSHVGGHSTKSSSRLMIRVHHQSAYVYLASQYRGWYFAPLRAVLWVGLKIRAEVVSG